MAALPNEYTAPELMATKPNQLWIWDITKLEAYVKSQYLHLYVILDVYSRYVVGWLVAGHRSMASRGLAPPVAPQVQGASHPGRPNIDADLRALIP